MKAPVARLKKKDLIWLDVNHCKHRHSYLDHYTCYLAENPNRERIGFLDIESSGLRADFGYVFSYCIKQLDGKIISRCLRPEEIRSGIFDRDLMKQMIIDLKKFDRIVTYFGTGFDVPFIRTRALFWGLTDFPLWGQLKHFDLFYVVKSKLKLSRSRLQTACDFFGIASKAHMMNPVQWINAQAGDKKSLDWVLIHNKEDVISTEALYKKLFPYSKPNEKSI